MSSKLSQSLMGFKSVLLQYFSRCKENILYKATSANDVFVFLNNLKTIFESIVPPTAFETLSAESSLESSPILEIIRISSDIRNYLSLGYFFLSKVRALKHESHRLASEFMSIKEYDFDQDTIVSPHPICHLPAYISRIVEYFQYAPILQWAHEKCEFTSLLFELHYNPPKEYKTQSFQFRAQKDKAKRQFLDRHFNRLPLIPLCDCFKATFSCKSPRLTGEIFHLVDSIDIPTKSTSSVMDFLDLLFSFSSTAEPTHGLPLCVFMQRPVCCMIKDTPILASRLRKTSRGDFDAVKMMEFTALMPKTSSLSDIFVSTYNSASSKPFNCSLSFSGGILASYAASLLARGNITPMVTPKLIEVLKLSPSDVSDCTNPINFYSPCHIRQCSYHGIVTNVSESILDVFKEFFEEDDEEDEEEDEYSSSSSSCSSKSDHSSKKDYSSPSLHKNLNDSSPESFVGYNEFHNATKDIFIFSIGLSSPKSSRSRRGFSEVASSSYFELFSGSGSKSSSCLGRNDNVSLWDAFWKRSIGAEERLKKCTLPVDFARIISDVCFDPSSLGRLNAALIDIPSLYDPSALLHKCSKSFASIHRSLGIRDKSSLDTDLSFYFSLNKTFGWMSQKKLDPFSFELMYSSSTDDDMTTDAFEDVDECSCSDDSSPSSSEEPSLPHSASGMMGAYSSTSMIHSDSFPSPSKSDAYVSSLREKLKGMSPSQRIDFLKSIKMEQELEITKLKNQKFAVDKEASHLKAEKDKISDDVKAFRELVRKEKMACKRAEDEFYDHCKKLRESREEKEHDQKSQAEGFKKSLQETEKEKRRKEKARQAALREERRLLKEKKEADDDIQAQSSRITRVRKSREKDEEDIEKRQKELDELETKKQIADKGKDILDIEKDQEEQKRLTRLRLFYASSAWYPSDWCVYRGICSSDSAKQPVLVPLKCLDTFQAFVDDTCITKYLGSGRDVVKTEKYNYLEVHKAYRIENPALWHKYYLYRQSIIDQYKSIDDKFTPLDAATDKTKLAKIILPNKHDPACLPIDMSKLSECKLSPKDIDTKMPADYHSPDLSAFVNEKLLFHGTKARFVDAIMRCGADFRLAANGMYGHGTYCAENSSKSDQYCVCGDDKLYPMFITRVVMGPCPYKSPTTCNGRIKPPPIPGTDLLYTSIHGRFREWSQHEFYGFGVFSSALLALNISQKYIHFRTQWIQCQAQNIQEVKPEFIHEGDKSCSPIPRDCPNVKSPDITVIKAKNRTKEKGDREYDQCSAAQKMMKGERNWGEFTDISLPFSTSTPIKGAYICIGGKSSSSPPPSHLIFSLTSSKGEKMFKKYKFLESEIISLLYLFSETDSWFFLPIDLSDVVLCEITGKGRKKESFTIFSLIFFREETHEETIFREAKEAFREKLWSEAQVVKPEFVQEGDRNSQGRYSIPIPRGDPKLVDPSFSMVKCKDDSKSKESEEFDQSSDAQRMLKGDRFVRLSYLSIPFPSPSPMKGAYICVYKYDSSPSLLFTFTDCDGKKTRKKYEFTRPKHVFEWHFLPIDLDNVVLCEIEGKGTWKEKNSRCFIILSLVFLREETPEERCIRESIEEQWSKAPTIKSEFIHRGNYLCSPIPRDCPNVKSPDITAIESKNRTKRKGDREYDQCSAAQKMMKGEGNRGKFTDISLPFSTSTPIKGAYICIGGGYYFCPPSRLIFSLTSSNGEKMVKKYEFPGLEKTSWFFLPIDLSDVVLCEISGKGRKKEYFEIESLVFISREETPEEIKACEAREKLWSETPVVKPKFVQEGDWTSQGRDSIPIPCDDPKLVDPSFSMVKCKNDSKSKESEEYDQSSGAQRMLKGEGFVRLSHLSIPFPSPSPMKGAFIYVDEDNSSPSLLFTFTDCDGKKTSKKYEFTEPKHYYEWHFLPIDLDNVVLCEIEGKGTWRRKNSRYFDIDSLIFFREETPEERCIRESIEEQWSKAPTIKSEFIHEGDESCSPIPRDSPNVKSPDITVIKAKNRTKGKGDREYDQSSAAQKMMKGEGYRGEFTEISLPFSTSTPIKGAYICIRGKYTLSPSHLIFSLTSSKGEKIFKKYEFLEFGGYHWYYLPIDLSDVVLCEIRGKGNWEESFGIISLKKCFFSIRSLVFISREETFEETQSREAREKLWSEVPVVKSEFVGIGHKEFQPIQFDDPAIIYPSFSMVKAKLDHYCKESSDYDQSERAKRMLELNYDGIWYRECDLFVSHLSIPFPSPRPMKGAYICVDKDDSSPSLLFTFTDSDGNKTSIKYEFTEPIYEFEWYFLPTDLSKIVLCEIEGKGMWKAKNTRKFKINYLVFLQQRVSLVRIRNIFDGSSRCIPTPRDDPTFICPDFAAIKVRRIKPGDVSQDFDTKSDSEGTILEDETDRDVIKVTSKAKAKDVIGDEIGQKIMKGEVCSFEDVGFSYISIPFKSSISIKGAYICLCDGLAAGDTYLFTFTISNGKKRYNTYQIPKRDRPSWWYLSIDLSDIVLCEIEGRKTKNNHFRIFSLAFYRKETPDEENNRKNRDFWQNRAWIETITIKPEFIKEGYRDSIPIPRDDESIINPSFSDVQGKNDVYCKEFGEYDQSSKAQKMLKGEDSVSLSHLSIPFPSPCLMKGAYICVANDLSSPSLLFRFSHSCGTKTFKRYIFSKFEEPTSKSTKEDFEFESNGLSKDSEFESIINTRWYFLPIDLPNVIFCEIQGKGTWKERLSRSFQIESLIFIKGEDIPPLPSDSTKLIKHDSFTLTSSATITSQCIIGHGGFGEVLLVKVEGIPIPCVLKKMLHEADERVVKGCRKEFKMQLKLFTNPKCFNRIPRPLYILDLLDADMKGEYGFIMEYCAGGSVKDFARSWCDDGKYVSDIGDADDSEDSDSSCISDSDSKSDIGTTRFDPMTLNPVKVSALCVGMIECLDDEFKMQLKLFTNPKCFNRIPRPLYILDLLDADMKGEYGFIMEYCAGGSVKDFARSWCDDGKYVSDIGDADDSEDSDSSCISDSDSKSDIGTTRFDPMTLNPVKVSALCVGMIECLDDVFRAKKSLVHRDVKPDNFLVRVDHDSKKCIIVLSDLGLAKIQDSISSSLYSSTASNFAPYSTILSGKEDNPSKQKGKCGTLVYNSYETLLDGTQTQKSDGYSLGMSILSLFLCEQPFTSLPIFREVYRKVRMGEADDFDIMKLLKRLMENDMCPRLSRSPLFKSLLTIEDGKYQAVHACLNEIFTRLTKLDEDERMSIHEAFEKVQSIKYLLPKIGEGFKCPPIEDIVKRQLAKFKRDAGCVEEEMEDGSEKEKDGKVSLVSTIQSKEKENRDIPSYDKKETHGLSTTLSTSTIQSSVGDHRDMMSFTDEIDSRGRRIIKPKEKEGK
ncbi:hypothetical protein ADUPG1_006082 [Aduncisulcus paluster]|uniref:Protein kinase domain-containing protein n=1 Tax=Aduncisulcus paluster TaxID=2918883 RepID=A0ABQ5KIJ3_9EUKA|nr:hypothetical protein ADUPG1_006082 [Aduncisulcus paluster]